jgi:flagellar biosynthetic protein FliQ
MTLGTAVALLRDGVLQLVIIAAPILLVSIVVGLAISILQATTSIQEQTLTFVPKILAMLGILLLLGPWIGSSMVEFTRRLFSSIPAMAL